MSSFYAASREVARLRSSGSTRVTVRRRLHVSVLQRPPNGEEDEARLDLPDADRLERDWEHALDTASGAVSASGRSGALTPQDVSEASQRIDKQRKWLRSFRPTLRKLFPRRRGRADQPPNTS
jgi:hypothetical protein